MEEKRKKLCFAASAGGHLKELQLLYPLMEDYDRFIVTEEVDYQADLPETRAYYLLQVNRKEPTFFFRMLVNAFRSLKIIVKERPDVIICTGVLAVIPLCLIGKLLGRKLIYIETVANIVKLTKTGKLLYPLADQFYVQWPQLRELYPKAICLGWIY